jgi:hypothetical protein
MDARRAAADPKTARRETHVAQERAANERQAQADQRQRLPDAGPMIERSQRLRQQALTAIEAFAANEEQIARLHEDMAASQPRHREEYRRVAERARVTARRAREIIRSVATDPQGQLATARPCRERTSADLESVLAQPSCRL